MATEATVQVLDSAVENAGVSTVTATKTVANPRNGVVYNPTTFAAGVPVWFHRRQDGRYMALYRSYWDAATSVYHDGPQLFSAHTAHGTPVYLLIDPTTGSAQGPYPLPGLDMLTGAVSLNDYLFTVGIKDGVGWVQHWFITRTGTLQLQGQETVPTGFSLGLFVAGNYLWVFGANGSGKLARIRKNWGRIGNNTDTTMQWECEGAKGWYTDLTEGASLPGDVPANGPCSMAKFRDRLYLMATRHISGSYQAVLYTSRPVDSMWKTVGDPIFLGDDTTYLGGAAYLQPQLVAKRELLPDGANAGFPYVTSVLVQITSSQAILTEWAILSV